MMIVRFGNVQTNEHDLLPAMYLIIFTEQRLHTNAKTHAASLLGICMKLLTEYGADLYYLRLQEQTPSRIVSPGCCTDPDVTPNTGVEGPGRSKRWDRQPGKRLQRKTLQRRHNERNGVSNHQPYDCLLNRLFRRRSKKTSKLHVTGLWEGNSPITGEFPAQRASHAENGSIWWRHHDERTPFRKI